MDRYENGMWVIKYIGGKLPVYTSLIDADLKAKGRDFKTATVDEIKEPEKSTTEHQIVYGLYPWSDRARFGKLIKEFENQHIQGIKSLPQTLSEAFTL